MNYNNPELRDRLAGEYVLGTLKGRARDRFERLLLDDPLLRDDVERWERHLNGLALALPQRQPPARIWRRIHRRIQPRPVQRSGWLWPLAAALATGTATMLALYIGLAPPQTQTLEPEFVATIGGDEQGPKWSVTADLDTDRLAIRTLRSATVGEDKALELWLLPAGGEAPISLGLLPEQGRAANVIPDVAARAAAGAAGIAISREPAGGSPTGAPTGPVLYKGRLIPI
jgi:anti-sigma-K factor RskA